MRVSSLLSAFIFLLISCSGPKQTVTSSPVSASNPGATATGTTATSDKSVNDGSSYEKAIVIDKSNESAGVAAEYKWLRDNYPGYTSQGQALQHNGQKIYDVLHIVTKSGEKKDVYFDITKFFGKF